MTTLAAHFFNVPFAQLTFIDEDRVWVKSCYGGIHIEQVKRSRSLSSHLLSLKHPVQIPETLLNLQFANMSVMTGIVGIRFFASAPITTPEGYNIGVLSIFDQVSQQLPDEKLSILSELASVVMDELELRITTVKSKEEEQELNTKDSIPQSSYKQNQLRFKVETKKGKSDSTVPPRCQNVEQLLQQYHETGERDFSGIDLSGKDLGGETLENANLSEAYLNGANFRGTKLRAVNLSGANLRGATFNGADLRKANLSFADVRGTDFSGADLRGANLTFVLLNEANITGAILCGAIMPDGSIRE